jgi:DNA-binding XRE family transcriptional regulator
MTQAVLGEKVGVSQSAVGQWERDEVTPSLRVRRALARVLRVQPPELFDENDSVGGRRVEAVGGAGGPHTLASPAHHAS